MAIDRKAQIYSKASSLFREHGYPGTTVRHIARELNIQAGSLYAHIDSKEDVLWEIVNRAAAQFMDAVEPVAESALPAEEKLRRMVGAHIQVVAENLADATMFFHEWKFLGDERKRLVGEMRDRYEGFFRRVVEEGMSTGEFAPGDPKMATMIVLSAVNWMPQWYNPEGPLSPHEVAGTFADLILRGLEPRPDGR